MGAHEQKHAPYAKSATNDKQCKCCFGNKQVCRKIQRDKKRQPTEDRVDKANESACGE
ncbi:hypothetical protein GCM10028797_08520 [Dyella agri]